jgi:hypothetical protein
VVVVLVLVVLVVLSLDLGGGRALLRLFRPLIFR